MSQFPEMAFQLLCAITFPPDGGSDPEDLADLERAWWQTIIHDLSPEDAAAMRRVVEREIGSLLSLPKLAPHEETKLSVLQGYVSGELS